MEAGGRGGEFVVPRSWFLVLGVGAWFFDPVGWCILHCGRCGQRMRRVPRFGGMGCLHRRCGLDRLRSPTPVGPNAGRHRVDQTQAGAGWTKCRPAPVGPIVEVTRHRLQMVPGPGAGISESRDPMPSQANALRSRIVPFQTGNRVWIGQALLANAPNAQPPPSIH